MTSLKPATDALDRVVVWIGATALVLLGLLICATVALRVVGSVIKGNGEIGEMLIIVVASTALLTATLTDGHPHVHMLIEKIATRWRYRIGAAITVLAALFWATAAWMNGAVALENAALIEETELLHIPLTPFRIVWIVALSLVALLLVARVVQTLRASTLRD